MNKAMNAGEVQRTAFFAQLDRILRATTFGTKTHCVIVLDIDRFRLVNQVYGERGGARCLHHVWQVLTSQLLEGDTLYYLGEDAFAILCPYRSAGEIITFAQSLLTAVAKKTWQCDQVSVPLTLSAGIAQSEDSDKRGDTVFARAEYALYRAKAAGGNEVESQLSAVDGGEEESASLWPERFHHAFLHDGFQVDIDSLEMAGDNPFYMVRTFLMVGKQRVALETIRDDIRAMDLLLSVDRWVMYKLFENPVANVSGDVRANVILPVSAASVQARQFIKNLERQLKATDLPPQRLWLAVSELDFPVSTAQLDQFLTQVTALGCRTLLTDFGCGTGSLVALFDHTVEAISPFPALAQRSSEEVESVVTALKLLCQRSGKLLFDTPL